MIDNSNRLIHTKNPYLLQHAHNPVDWFPWGKEAFAMSRSMDKPILLSIGYSTCHWCHVMAHESFEDKDIANLINTHFIPIKVDREERPDIDHIYMTAVTAMTGQGGWPLTVFLTSDGKPFYGGTYFPPYAKWGSVGFADLLANIANSWANNRTEITTSANDLTQALQGRSQRHQLTGDLPLNQKDYLHKAYGHLSGQYDRHFGGFGSAPKFPMTPQLGFLLRYYKKTGEVQALAMIEKTLKSMAQGGIYDHLAGGFHRYSTDGKWHVPHFEKMLYDQALLSNVYLEAFQMTGDVFYADVARDTLNYVLKDMRDPVGAFYSAEDADSLMPEGGHEVEGAFYVFSAEEVISILGKRDAAVFSFCYGVQDGGNAANDPHGEFRGKNILFLAHDVSQAAAQFKLSPDDIELILTSSRSKLLSFRNTRPRPHLDDKVLVDWNGLMIASLALAGRVLGDAEFTKAAMDAADFILDQMLLSDGRLLHRWRQDDAAVDATLDDYAFFIYGLLGLYEATFQDKYLTHAQDLAMKMGDTFKDPLGGFFMTPTDGEELIFRPKEAYDGALPSGNGIAALNLLRLYALTNNVRYQEMAKALLVYFQPMMEQMPSSFASLLIAQDFDQDGPVLITLQGNPADPLYHKMLHLIYKDFILYRVVGWKKGDKVSAYVCHSGLCHAPVDDVDALKKDLIRYEISNNIHKE